MEHELLKSSLMKRKSKKAKAPVRSHEVPATAAMLFEMEDRLSHKIESEISGVRSEINGVKSEVHGLKAEISGIRSEVHGLKSEISGVKSELHRVALLVEEQNARNKYVMDGYAQLYELLALRNS